MPPMRARWRSNCANWMSKRSRCVSFTPGPIRHTNKRRANVTAKKIPLATMESGPVGGIIAAAEATRGLGLRNAIAFDMGGTTAKVSLVQDNEPDIAQGYFI